jgi:hypothetical protein
MSTIELLSFESLIIVLSNYIEEDLIPCIQTKEEAILVAQAVLESGDIDEIEFIIELEQDY